ncbi:rhodanese-like domain-containing protein [Fibrisoma montanum]|uniref:Rhodanese-like domain-containing protein n=1 Tax=Fibrisoma montanum TaxID=2305895 RepID=A0A418MAG6_9BACT|nr:rhodanese-like domain-containing protein [Fibrisoma montanum]RIV23350.1 rhodanese-like domain-containing protein [Fibrisoma montanum]
MKTLLFLILPWLYAPNPHPTVGGPVVFIQQDGPKNLTPQQAAQLLKESPGVVILDVRTPTEFSSGHIKGAINVDYNSPTFQQQVARLDKTKPYLVHCAVGGRSTQSLPILQKLGFTNVRHLDGGVKAWQQAGLPLVK